MKSHLFGNAPAQMEDTLLSRITINPVSRPINQEAVVHVASIPQEVRDEARAAGVTTQADLLKVAAAAPEKQVEVVAGLVKAKNREGEAQEPRRRSARCVKSYSTPASTRSSQSPRPSSRTSRELRATGRHRINIDLLISTAQMMQ